MSDIHEMLIKISPALSKLNAKPDCLLVMLKQCQTHCFSITSKNLRMLSWYLLKIIAKARSLPLKSLKNTLLIMFLTLSFTVSLLQPITSSQHVSGYVVSFSLFKWYHWLFSQSAGLLTPQQLNFRWIPSNAKVTRSSIEYSVSRSWRRDELKSPRDTEYCNAKAETPATDSTRRARFRLWDN